MGDFTKYFRSMFILAVLLTACHPTTRTSQSINFFSLGQIPIVEGRINGKVAYFIVDTGASCSILNESAAKHFGFKTMMTADDHLVGLNGAARIQTAYSYAIELGPLKIKSLIFRTRKIDELVDVIKNNDSVSIAGIIGADVLKKYQMGIDFRTNKISFLHRAPAGIESPANVTMNSQVAND